MTSNININIFSTTKENKNKKTNIYYLQAVLSFWFYSAAEVVYTSKA